MKGETTLIKPFKGIPESALVFLRELEANNDRGWFRENEDWYRNDVEGPMASLAAALGDSVRPFASSAVAEPRIGGSLFRIQRDMRFATGVPYKTHVGLRIRHVAAIHGSRCEGPVMYVQYSGDGLLLGVGEKAFDSHIRARWLELLQKDASVVTEAAATAERSDHEILGQLLKRPPITHSDLRVSELARRKGFFVQKSGPLPRSMHAPSFAGQCSAFFRLYAGLFEALGSLHDVSGGRPGQI